MECNDMETMIHLQAPNTVTIGSPMEVLGIALDTPWPAPFVETAGRLAGLRGCSLEEAEEYLTGGTLYALPLGNAAREDFFATHGVHDEDSAAPYIDFDRYAEDCLADGRLLQFEWNGRGFVAAPSGAC